MDNTWLTNDSLTTDSGPSLPLWTPSLQSVHPVPLQNLKQRSCHLSGTLVCTSQKCSSEMTTRLLSNISLFTPSFPFSFLRWHQKGYSLPRPNLISTSYHLSTLYVKVLSQFPVHTLKVLPFLKINKIIIDIVITDPVIVYHPRVINDPLPYLINLHLISFWHTSSCWTQNQNSRSPY